MGRDLFENIIVDCLVLFKLLFSFLAGSQIKTGEFNTLSRNTFNAKCNFLTYYTAQ
jgi:hypothetical protein